MKRVAVLLVAATLASCRSEPPPPALDTLAVLHERDVEGLDPHTAGTVWQTQTVLANIYEGLVALDAGMRVVPALAGEWTNPDDVTLEFRLRPGVRFHDGSALTSEDVAWSFERARTHPRSVLRAAVADVVSVEQLGPDRVRMRTARPDAALVARLRDVTVLSKSCVARVGDAGLETVSCGTGAYRLASHTPGLGVDLERFDGHWAGQPAIPRARFLARTWGDPSLATLLSPTTRVAFFVRPATPLFERAQQEAVLHRGSGLGVSYLAFDLHGPQTAGVTLPDGRHTNPFLDVRVRKAIALAIDHGELNRRIYEGRAQVATQLVPGVVYGFDRDVPEPRHDLAEARRLLAQTPYRDGFEVELDTRRMMLRYGEPVRDHLTALGLRVKLNLLEEDEFFRKVEGGRSSLFVLRFSCRSGDAQELLDKWVHSEAPAQGLGIANHAWDQCPLPELDAQIDAARRELRPQERLLAMNRILRRLNEEQLAVPLLQDVDLTFASPEVDWKPRADTFRIIREARFRPR
jgi:peptide/nickel transport system substrate-binding protein